MRALLKTLACTLAATVLAASAPAEKIVIRNGALYPVEGPPIENSVVIVEDGKITLAADATVIRLADPGPGAIIIDATGRRIYPGFFAAYSQLGLVEISAVATTDDRDEKAGNNTAQVAAVDGYNPESSLIPITRTNGITHVLAAPAEGNVIAGQGSVMQLDGGTRDAALVKSPVALHVSLGEAPKGRNASKMPSTRMGIVAWLRGEFTKATEYRDKLDRHAEAVKKHEKKLAEFPKKKAEWEAKPEADRGDEPKPPEAPTPPERDLQKDVLVKALRGEIAVAFTAQRLDDIEAAVRIGDEFALRCVIVGGADAYKMAGVLAEKKIPVILAATEQPKYMENLGASYQNARILNESGVKIAFMTSDTSHNVRNLPYEAGVAVAHGLPEDAALRALTINPAEIWGVDKELGGVVPGKRANLIVTTGDPLQPATKIEHLIIGGREVSRRTRQDDLAEQHAPKFLPPGATNPK